MSSDPLLPGPPVAMQRLECRQHCLDRLPATDCTAECPLLFTLSDALGRPEVRGGQPALQLAHALWVLRLVRGQRILRGVCSQSCVCQLFLVFKLHHLIQYFMNPRNVSKKGRTSMNSKLIALRKTKKAGTEMLRLHHTESRGEVGRSAEVCESGAPVADRLLCC